MLAFLTVAVLYVRVAELTTTAIVFRREPPHTDLNVDIPFDQIAEAVETQREYEGWKTQIFSSYEPKLKDGRSIELPGNKVLSAARDTIDQELHQRGIPVIVKEPPPPGPARTLD